MNKTTFTPPPTELATDNTHVIVDFLKWLTKGGLALTDLSDIFTKCGLTPNGIITIKSTVISDYLFEDNCNTKYFLTLQQDPVTKNLLLYVVAEPLDLSPINKYEIFVDNGNISVVVSK